MIRLPESTRVFPCETLSWNIDADLNGMSLALMGDLRHDRPGS